MKQPIKGKEADLPNIEQMKLAAKHWGAQGGRKVTGEKKRRSKEHYARLARLGVEARERKRADSNKASTGKAK